MADKQNITIVVKAKGIKQAQAQMRKLGGSTDRVTGGMGSMIAKIGGATVAMFAMQRAISASVKEFSQFEQGMADVRAITNSSGIEFLKLSDSAKQLGASTKFTAFEVASLQKEYAKLGFTTSEIQNVQKATLDLASAVGSELGESAEIAGSTLRGFGMDAKDTSRVTDTMALSFSRSALDMRKFSDSMTYVAPVAKMAGFQMEGTTAILGTLANSGIDGSMAGTALRRVFLELSNDSSKLSKRLGGQVTSIEELIPALEKLKKEGVTTAEMQDLVGQRAVSAFSVLMDGTDTLKDLSEEFKNAGGSAERMANIQLDTLEGKTTIMKSALSGLQIAVGEQLAPALELAVEGLTNMFSSMTKVFEIPMSAKLEEDRNSVNALLMTLEDSNVPLETRKGIMEELNTSYKTYLPNLLNEESTIDDIRKAREKANESFMQAIILQANEEDLQEAISDNKEMLEEYGQAIVSTNEAKVKAQEADKKLEESLAKLQKKYGEDLTQTQLLNLAKEKQKEIEDEIIRTRQQEDQNQDIAGLNQRINAQNVSNQLMDKELVNLENLVFQQSEANQGLQDAIALEEDYSDQVDYFNEQMNQKQLGYDELLERMKKDKKGLEDNSKAVNDNRTAIQKATDAVSEFYKAKLSSIQIDEKMIQSSMRVGASQQNLEQAVLRASLGMIQSQIQTTVAGYIKNWTIGQPFPVNLLGIPAGAVFGQLLNEVVQRQYATANQGKKKYAEGGLIVGNSHSAGGVGIEAEGGEFIMSRRATESIGVDALNAMNQGTSAPNINVSISAPLVDETVTESIVPALRDAIRRGELTNEDISPAL